MSDSTENLDELFEYHHEKLDKFEEWISTQSHIPKNFPKAILFRYLKVCRFNLEESKKLLDINVKFRIENQYLFTDRDIEYEEFQKNAIQYACFPKLTKEGYAVESYRIINPQLDNYNIKDLAKLVVMAHDVNSLIEPNTNGLVVIHDANGFTFQHFMKLVSNIRTVTHLSQYGQEVSCVDLKQVHYVNCSPIVIKAVSFFKSLIPKELNDKSHFHSSGFETLHKFIAKEDLPIEYGGTEGSLKDYQEITLGKLRKHRDFVMKDDNFFLLDN